MEEPTCPQCGATNPAANRFCSRCGGNLAPSPSSSPSSAGTKLPLQWKWVAIGAAAVVAVQFGVGIAFAVVLGDAIADGGSFLGLVLGSLAGYAVAGFAVAYASPGLTLREPAIGAAIAVAVFNLASGNLGSIVLGWIMPFLLTLAGAKLGERLQAGRVAARP